MCLRKGFAICEDASKTVRITLFNFKKRERTARAIRVHASEREESQNISKANLGEASVLRKGSQQKFQ